MKLILHLVPIQSLISLFFDSGVQNLDILFPGLGPLGTTFKAVLIAVDMTKALQIPRYGKRPYFELIFFEPFLKGLRRGSLSRRKVSLKYIY